MLNELNSEIEEIEEILVGIADVIGSLFQTHKELTLEIVDKLLTELLPKYFKPESTVFETKMGLFIVDDMIEFLGQDLLGKIWGDIAKLVVNYADNSSVPLRQAACYGIGEFAANTKSNFNLYSEEMLSAIYKAYQYNDDGVSKEAWGFCRDNITSALGKLIFYQSSHLSDLVTIINAYITNMPLNFDVKQSKLQHKLFVDCLINSPDYLVGNNKENLPKIIRILGKLYNSPYVSEETNLSIKNILENMKNNSSMTSFILAAKDGCAINILQNLEEFFN